MRGDFQRDDAIRDGGQGEPHLVKDEMHITVEMVAALVLAFFGFVSTVTGVILQLRISGVLKDVSVEIQKIEVKIEKARSEASTANGHVQLGVEQLKTKFAEAAADNYKQLTSEIKQTYIEREVANSKHSQNVERLQTLTDGLKDIRETIGEMRGSIERRLVSIEERLPT